MSLVLQNNLVMSGGSSSGQGSIDLSAYRKAADQDIIDKTKQEKLTAGTGIDITDNVISVKSNPFVDGTFDDSTTIPSTITFDIDKPTLYYTDSTNTSLSFDTFNCTSALNDGVYTWELICSSDSAITRTTYGSSIQYVGNDLAYNPSLSFNLIDNTRTAHVFSVRLIKHGSTSTCMFAYNYSFKG